MFERKRMCNDEVPIRFVDIMGFMQYTGLGRNSAMKLGKKQDVAGKWENALSMI